MGPDGLIGKDGFTEHFRNFGETFCNAFQAIVLGGEASGCLGDSGGISGQLWINSAEDDPERCLEGRFRGSDGTLEGSLEKTDGSVCWGRCCRGGFH